MNHLLWRDSPSTDRYMWPTKVTNSLNPCEVFLHCVLRCGHCILFYAVFTCISIDVWNPSSFIFAFLICLNNLNGIAWNKPHINLILSLALYHHLLIYSRDTILTQKHQCGSTYILIFWFKFIFLNCTYTVVS